MSKPPLDLDDADPGQGKSRRVDGSNPPMATALRMVAFAIVILAGAILCGLGSLGSGSNASGALAFGTLIIAAGALMLVYAMSR